MRRAVALSVLLLSCRGRAADAGSLANPVRIGLFPATSGHAAEQWRTFVARLLEHERLHAAVWTPPNYRAALEDLGEGRADVAFLGNFAYLLAHDEYGARAALQVVRKGARTQKGVIVARAGGGIRSVADLRGRRVAFTDPYSTSGFVLAAAALRDVAPGRTLFAGSHARAVEMVRKGEADAAATYAGHAAAGLAIVAETGEAPNEPVVVRKGFADDVARRVVAQLVVWAGTPDGRRALASLADITELAPAPPEAWDGLRALVAGAGSRIEDLVPGGWILHVKNAPPKVY